MHHMPNPKATFYPLPERGRVLRLALIRLQRLVKSGWLHPTHAVTRCGSLIPEVAPPYVGSVGAHISQAETH